MPFSQIHSISWKSLYHQSVLMYMTFVTALLLRSLLDVYFNQMGVNAFATKVSHSKVTSKNKWKYLTRRQMSTECITHQISSNNRQPVITIWFESNRDFMPFKYQYNSFQSYVFQRLDLIFSTYKAGWFDKLSLMSNSFHCWRTLWGCCFFFFPTLSLHCAN